MTEPRNLRILIVDDDKAIRAILHQILTASGHLINTASDGNDALSKIKSFDGEIPHLVMTDREMPGMGGEELIRRLQTEHPSIKIVWMSGGIQPDEFKKMGAKLNIDPSRILAKPFRPHILMETLDRIFPQKR